MAQAQILFPQAERLKMLVADIVITKKRSDPMAGKVAASREMGAPAERVWSMVTDMTQMGRSPENDGANVGRATDGPRPGAVFTSTNRNGKKTWATVGTIVDVKPGHLFSFRIKARGLAIAEWRYAFERTPSGCRVTETWIDRRGPLAKLIGRWVTGVADRTTHNRVSMEQTLDCLKSAAESTTSVTG
jgi:uncharacterized protein YndB with AHSA1/START domain